VVAPIVAGRSPAFAVSAQIFVATTRDLKVRAALRSFWLRRRGAISIGSIVSSVLLDIALDLLLFRPDAFGVWTRSRLDRRFKFAPSIVVPPPQYYRLEYILTDCWLIWVGFTWAIGVSYRYRSCWKGATTVCCHVILLAYLKLANPVSTVDPGQTRLKIALFCDRNNFSTTAPNN
jgi:hypothetical protein